MNIGKAMLAVRQEFGLSRPKMAEALGITNGALWKIETGKTTPKPATIERLCFVTRTPLARFYHLSFEARDFAPYAAVRDVRVALRESGAFSDEEIDEIDSKLRNKLFD